MVTLLRLDEQIRLQFQHAAAVQPLCRDVLLVVPADVDVGIPRAFDRLADLVNRVKSLGAEATR